MLQAALFLLACGLCRYMWSVNASVAYTLISLTGLGVVFYVAIVIAGTSSYACPFQTPISIALHGPWKRVRQRITSYVAHSKRILAWTSQMWSRKVRPLPRHQSLPMTRLENDQSQRPAQWLKPKELGIILATNTNDARCVSWILRNITDPEALDAAVRLAGEIRWFDGGANVDLPYDLVVSTSEACFDRTGKLYPGSRDRAYYSGRAMMWVHTLAMCKSKEFARTFPLPDAGYTAPVLDPDLRHLFSVLSHPSPDFPSLDLRCAKLLRISPERTPSHSQWISSALLHLSWANRTKLHHEYILDRISSTHETTIPLNATLNRLLVWCIFLGSPAEEEVLKVQDKSYDISCSRLSGYS